VKKPKLACTPLLFSCVAALLILVVLFFVTTDSSTAGDSAAAVVKEYLAATYARDFVRAYHLISERDKKIISQSDFVQSRGAYSGFAQRVAEDLAQGMEFNVLEDVRAGERASIKAAVKLPEADDLSPLVENWDAERLNKLSPAQRRIILERIANLRREQKLLWVESQESFDLIKEGHNWRFFFDWASGTRVRFAFHAPAGSGVEMDFAEKEIVARPQEPFLVHFKIKNGGRREVIATIGHRVEPATAADNLLMIQCGLLSPTLLAPGAEREMAGVYLLDGPVEVKHLSIAYEFQSVPASVKSRAVARAKGA
jgi:hypothetical protein